MQQKSGKMAEALSKSISALAFQVPSSVGDDDATPVAVCSNNSRPQECHHVTVIAPSGQRIS